MVIGVISDTHGLLRPEAVAALRGSEYILHGGDIDSPEVLFELSKIAPVTAVRGNVDPEEWPSKLSQTEMVELGGVGIYIIHDLSRLDLKPEAAGIRVVVYGHSHQPKIEERNGVLYFNPGSPGPKRFNLPVSVGRLYVESGQVRAELIELSV
jgi:putative phosphoesterase